MPNPTYPQYLMPYMQYPYQMPQQNQSTQNKQVQNAGFIMVRSEEEAYQYPVAAGNCVTFKVENEPIVIEKSMSFSQLDNPKIDRYRLVREEIIDPAPIEAVEVNIPDYDIRDELQAIRDELEGIKRKLYNNVKPSKKREGEDDE